jgi:alpha-mannosidase
VRHSENNIISAQKLAVMTKVYAGADYPQIDFDHAWRPLLLSQHHDCWIVPYNGKPGDTWADKVVTWTGTTNHITDSLIKLDVARLANNKAANGNKYITIYNTLGIRRNESVTIDIPAGLQAKNFVVLNSAGQPVASQMVSDSASAAPQIVFNADVPPMGYVTYQLKAEKATSTKKMGVEVLKDGCYRLENDLYTIIIDPKKGGTIKSLIAKKLNNREFVDAKNPRSFNELRGNFYNDGGKHSSAENPAKVTVLENGSERIKVQLKGFIDGSPFTQWITLTRGQPRIDMQMKIDWKGNPGIGEYTPPGTFKATNYKKAFYNDREKLLLLFTLNLPEQKIYKDAPFDVLQSRLKNTFFTSWDSIKNNIILNWVDVTNKDNSYGMALFTDHTTNYAHGEDFPLGLTLAYSGVGLWGRDYRITGPTSVHYAIMPHAGKWDKSHIWTAADKWNTPLIAIVSDRKPKANQWSMLSATGLDITNLNASGNDLTIRIFNAEGDSNPQTISFNGNADKAELVELDGRIKQTLPLQKIGGKTVMTVSMPRFGIRTIKLYNAVKSE